MVSGARRSPPTVTDGLGFVKTNTPSRDCRVDVVTVAYNSARELRRCVEHLCRSEGVRVIVVDNSSEDASLETVGDLDLTAIRLESNHGFAAGCNIGWRTGESPYVLFVNPDARISPEAIERLVAVAAGDPEAGAVAPAIVHEDGTPAHSLRSFPRLRSTFAQALFLHRLFPTSSWADELIRDERAYQRRWSPDWVSGACLLVKRSVLDELEGWDERFFLFGEDIDLCRRLRAVGRTLWFEPSATCVHVGGASASTSTSLPLLTAGRLRYISLHHGSTRRIAEHAGMGLGSLLRIFVGRPGTRRAHARSLLVALGVPAPKPPSRSARSAERSSGRTAVAVARRTR